MIIYVHIKYRGSLHIVVQINANVKIVTPWGSRLFITRAIISINLEEVHWQMLYTKYQSSRSCSFR